MSATWVCIAGGPSLNFTQIARVKSAKAKGLCKVMAVSDAYRLVAESDVIYSTDGKWWDWHYKKIEVACQGQLITCDLAASMKYERVTWIEGRKLEDGFSFEPGVIHLGKNSGFAALNLALLLGAKKVLLIGYDMRRHERESDKETQTFGLLHWFGDHPVRQMPPMFNYWIEKFESTVNQVKGKGIEIVNCSPGSALTCYRMGTLEQELVLQD